MHLILNKCQLLHLDDNWTMILGQVIGVSNSQERRKKYSIASYTTIFGQSYHPQIKVPVATMHQCETITKHLWISHDERLEKFVTENNIVDLDEGSGVT